MSTKKEVNEMIEKKHAIYSTNEYNSKIGGIDTEVIRYLKSFNIEFSSMLLNPNSVTYEDYDNGTHIFYQLPYKKGTKKPNFEYAWKFINNNKSNRIKFITCGNKPKMEYVQYPELVPWRNLMCIRVQKYPWN